MGPLVRSADSVRPAPPKRCRALATRARELHARGEPFKVRVLIGASSSVSIDEDLAQAQANAWRAPYMSGAMLPDLDLSEFSPTAS